MHQTQGQLPTFLKTLLDLSAQIHPNTVTVGDMNTPLSPISRSLRQKINKETSELLHTLEQMDIIDNYRVLHPITASAHSFLQPIELSPKLIVF
jgi:hypothetical protein